MPEYYDDNFGHWEGMEDEDMREFYFQTQRENVQKVCDRCGRSVMLRPDYAICARCADAIEMGMDY